MIKYKFSNHARWDRQHILSDFATKREILEAVTTKKEHDQPGSHWVLVKEFSRKYEVQYPDGTRGIGDRLIAIVREDTIVTVMLREREELLPDNCHYYWN